MQLISILAFGTSVAALALPLPQSTGNSGENPYPVDTQITYYQGRKSDAGFSTTAAKYPLADPGDSSCGVAVSTGTITASHCHVFHTAGVGIMGTQNGSCSLTLYTGTTMCTGGQKSVVQVPNGDSETCISTGVLDGGEYEHASGVWLCG